MMFVCSLPFLISVPRDCGISWVSFFLFRVAHLLHVIFQTSMELTLPESGPYSIQLTAIDKAGNVKHTRRVLLFDDSSIIELHGDPPIVKSADPNTTYKWINKMVSEVEISWSGRFINKIVSTGKWLNEIKADDSVSRELDDSVTISARNTSAIDNIDGMVKENNYTFRENCVIFLPHQF